MNCKKKTFNRTIDLVNMIDCKPSGEWKINLTIKINFSSSRGSNEKQLMNSKNGNIEIMIGNDADKTINDLFSLLSCRYEIGLEESIKVSDFI